MKKEILKTYKGQIENIIKRLPKEDKDILNKYLTYRRTTASEDKVRHYRTKIIILRDITTKPFNKFNDEELMQKLITLINDSNRKDSEKNELKKVLKNFLVWLFEDIRFMKNLKEGLKSKKIISEIDKSDLPTEEEFEKMFLACKNLQEKAMITLQDELALRPTELLNLKWSDVKDDETAIKVRGEKCDNAKRTLPLNSAVTHLKRWKQEFKYPNRRDDDFVFPSEEDRTKPYYKQYLNALYRRLCQGAGIRSITPYSIRHRRITFVWEKTKDLKLTAKFGGHSIEVCQDTYQHSSDNDIKDLIRSEVYDIKEPSPEQKSKMQKEIDVLKNQLKRFESRIPTADKVMAWTKRILKARKV